MKSNNLIDKNIDNKTQGDKYINDVVEINSVNIKDLIYTIRGKQVMMDSDLAMLYGVTTGNLNKSMKRNKDRFPDDFCFELTEDEYKNLIFHFGISSSKNNYGGRRTMPKVYTEQGIAMLSAIVKSDIATKVSINIMRTFVEMRKYLRSNEELFSRLDRIELKQLEYQKDTDQKFEQVFDYIAERKEVSQKVFFDGQIYDAYSLLVSIIKKAKESINLIDNFVDTTTLDILSKKQESVKVNIYTSKKSKLTDTEIKKFNKQYGNLTRAYIKTFHDRFMILDNRECYHIGTSIKDAGNKSFAITRIADDETIKHILSRLE